MRCSYSCTFTRNANHMLERTRESFLLLTSHPSNTKLSLFVPIMDSPCQIYACGRCQNVVHQSRKVLRHPASRKLWVFLFTFLLLQSRPLYLLRVKHEDRELQVLRTWVLELSCIDSHPGSVVQQLYELGKVL